ncbi:MAG: glycyl-radical enzyme activating protein [Ignavibacteria bacterium]|nr:glycyl-radical enzyme activating protein [Ignavibacteria bacterium]
MSSRKLIMNLMKGIIFDIKRFAMNDGPGIRTVVFFRGCPMRCWWCQNPECFIEIPNSISNLSQSSPNPIDKSHSQIQIKEISVFELIDEIRKDQIFYEQSNGGVTFSGGEPLYQIEFLFEALKLCKKIGIHTAVDTSGYAQFDNFEKIIPITDLVLFDLKLIDDTLHKKYTEVSNELILENLKRLSKTKANLCIRVPLIPGITDTEENLTLICEFLSELDNSFSIDLLPYNKLAESKYKRYNLNNRIGILEPQSEEKLLDIKTIFNRLNKKVSIRS